jgi:hypothetical protein
MESSRLLRLAFLVSAAALSAGLAGCATDTTSAAPADDGAAVDELNATNLRAATALKGTVTAGSAATLSYNREDSDYPRGIPYLALQIVAPPAPSYADDPASGGITMKSGDALGGQTITVTGDFPGRPKVIVVDQNFVQLASTTAKTLADGTAQATVEAPRGVEKRFVLVHDARWSKPMSFQVSVGQ